MGGPLVKIYCEKEFRIIYEIVIHDVLECLYLINQYLTKRWHVSKIWTGYYTTCEIREGMKKPHEIYVT